MSEFIASVPEALVETVRQTENEREEGWREKFLAENLFHNNHLDDVLRRSEDRIQLLNLEHQFLQDKQDKNMGERFDLALSDRYLGKIHVVELGRTTNPGANGEIDGLKTEYNDLLRWMQQNGIVERELSRQESGRNISVRKPALDEAADRLAIMVRNRPLIQTSLVHNGQQLDIAIAKRMVFSLPRESLKPLLAINPNLCGEEVQQFIEDRFLKNGWGGVRPIRTAYYLATDIR